MLTPPELNQQFSSPAERAAAQDEPQWLGEFLREVVAAASGTAPDAVAMRIWRYWPAGKEHIAMTKRGLAGQHSVAIRLQNADPALLGRVSWPAAEAPNNQVCASP